MRGASRKSAARVGVAAIVMFGALAAYVGGARATTSIVLSAPTYTCGSPPVVTLAWTDTAAIAYYRPLWKTPTDLNWNYGAWTAANARSTTVTATAGATEQYMVQSWTTVYTNSNVQQVTISCGTTNKPPTANAGADQTVAAGTPVTFNGSGTDTDGTVVSYAWTFGDGGTAATASATHTYTVAGTYTATLTVTDNAGARGTDTATVTVSPASPPPGNWAKAIGGIGSDAVTAVASDSTGNVYVTGTFNNSITIGTTPLTSAGQSDWFLAKFSAAGVVQWAKRFGGTDVDQANGLAVDASGNVNVVGDFVGTSDFGGTSPLVSTPAAVGGSGLDMFVAQYSGANGAYHWAKRFGGGYSDQASGVAVDVAGNVYFTGYFENTIDFGGGPMSVPYTSDLDVFIAKFTSAGAYAWAKHFTNTGNDRGYGVAVDALGNVTIGGSFSNGIDFGGGTLGSANGMVDAFLARFDTNGTFKWQRRIGSANGNESIRSVAVDASGNVVAVGTVVQPVDFGGGLTAAFGAGDGFVAKYAAANGAYQWAKRIGGTSNDYASGVAVDGSGNVFVAGSFSSSPADFGGISKYTLGGGDAYLAKYSSTGVISWARDYGGANEENFYAVAVSSGSPVAGGYFYGTSTFDGTTVTSAGMADAILMRTSP